MARVTLRLPESLHARLVAESRATDRSLNELIVESLETRLPDVPSSVDEKRELMRKALGDLLVSVDEVMPLWPGEEEDAPVLTHEELVARLPRLDPPLSQTIIEDREDRV